MSFRTTLFDTFDDHGKAYCAELPEVDLRRLKAAYLRDNPEVAYDALCDLNTASLAGYLADLMHSVEQCDVLAMANQLRHCVDTSRELESLIDGEIDYLWKSYLLERQETAA